MLDAVAESRTRWPRMAVTARSFIDLFICYCCIIIRPLSELETSIWKRKRQKKPMKCRTTGRLWDVGDSMRTNRWCIIWWRWLYYDIDSKNGAASAWHLAWSLQVVYSIGYVFNHYNDRGEFDYHIAKKRKMVKRWQFHFESGQFMDASDEK